MPGSPGYKRLKNRLVSSFIEEIYVDDHFLMADNGDCILYYYGKICAFQITIIIYYEVDINNQRSPFVSEIYLFKAVFLFSLQDNAKETPTKRNRNQDRSASPYRWSVTRNLSSELFGTCSLISKVPEDILAN